MVPDIAALTTHDVMLYEEVSAKRVLNPYDMRLAALGVAKTGLAGPKAAEAATAALIENEKFKALNQLMLILRVIEETGISTAKSLAREIATMHDLLGQIRSGWQSSEAAPRFAAAMEGHLVDAAALKDALLAQGTALTTAAQQFAATEDAVADAIPAVA